MLSCTDGNPYVQELLRGPATLESLSVMVDDGQIYSSRPDFNKDILEYTVRVPYATQNIRIMAKPNKNGAAYFTMNNITNNDGAFLFLDDQQAAVEIYVERPHMDSRTYTLRVIRGSDSTLWDINFSQTILLEGGHTSEVSINNMDPGYDSDTHKYKLPVQANTDKITIITVLRPYAEAAFFKDTSLLGTTYDANLGPYYGLTDQEDVYNLSGFSHVPGVWSKEFDVSSLVGNPLAFYIKVWMKNPDTLAPEPTSAELYKITIDWPNKVEHDTSLWSPPVNSEKYSSISIKGIPVHSEYFFNAGQPVTFTLSPPFGARTSYAAWSDDDWATSKSLDVNIADSYSFIMPQRKNVKIRAAFEEVPGVSGVKYARPAGTGDGSKWYTAADINTLITNYTGSYPYDYEIWLAEGTYNPPGTAGDFNRSFILKNNIKIYGGFRGIETALNQREYSDSGKTRPRYISELSGNYPNGDRIYHTVIASGITTAYMDGLTIQGSSNAYWSGSGITVNTNTILVSYGGVFYVVNSSPVLKNVTLQGGLSSLSAGMYVTGASLPVLLHCRFTNNQSSGYGSALGIIGAAESHLLAIGGIMDVNLDAGGVVFIGDKQKATMINVSIVNNKEVAVNHYPFSPAGSNATGNFVNCTITGNRSNNDDIPHNIVSTGNYWNSLIHNNISDTEFQTQWGAPEMVLDMDLENKNTYAPGYAHSIGSSSLPGNINYYPLTSNGIWNTNCTIVEDIFTDPAAPFGATHPYAADLGMSDIIIDALKLDGNGKPRFSNGTIKLGAVQ